MKKGFIILLFVLVIAIVCSFIFIPSAITVSGYKTINCPSLSVARVFERGGDFKKWWPGEINNDHLTLQNFHYTIPKSNVLGIKIRTELSDVSIEGDISSMHVNKDSSAIQLQYQSFNASFNPLKRVEYYFKALTLKKQLNNILESFKQFAEDKKNIYGLNIVETKVKDSSLISTKKSFDHSPTNKEVGDLVNKLKQHIAANGGVINDYPMLNIHINEENKYEAMVAIPLLKDIPVKGDIVIKKMILGNILEAKLMGGNAAINDGLNALKDYAKDYGKVAPAIPFQLMITDRNRETDTTKWVTVLKYPVF